MGIWAMMREVSERREAERALRTKLATSGDRVGFGRPTRHRHSMRSTRTESVHPDTPLRLPDTTTTRLPGMAHAQRPPSSATLLGRQRFGRGRRCQHRGLECPTRTRSAPAPTHVRISQQRQRRSLARQAQRRVAGAGEAAQRRRAESPSQFAGGRRDRIADAHVVAVFLGDPLRVCPSRVMSSAASTNRAIVATVWAGYAPTLDSADSITASVPSKTALATSLTSARVGPARDHQSSICVATITGLPPGGTGRWPASAPTGPAPAASPRRDPRGPPSGRRTPPRSPTGPKPLPVSRVSP